MKINERFLYGNGVIKRMKPNNSNIFTNVAVSLITALIVSLILARVTYYSTIEGQKHEAMMKFREDKYSNLLVYLQGFMTNNDSAEVRKKFFEEQYKSWLYCSDDVVRAVNDFENLLNPQMVHSKGFQTKAKIAVANIVLAMRRDLLEKTNLKSTDFEYKQYNPLK